MLSVRSRADLPVHIGPGVTELRHLDPADPLGPDDPPVRLAEVRLRPRARHHLVVPHGSEATVLVIDASIEVSGHGRLMDGASLVLDGPASLVAGADGARMIVVTVPAGIPRAPGEAPWLAGRADGWEGVGRPRPRPSDVPMVLRRRLRPGEEGHLTLASGAPGYLVVTRGVAHLATDIDASDLRDGDGAQVPRGITLSVRSRGAGADVLLVVGPERD